ncbi:transcriptional repressor LexA [Vreelandella populi]|uniref:LexA repressor n=1 Tax=Vreelandella populi TaxID=2498858 RepID=A0A3S0YPS4_9GAMM|nr:transcriptional repressor LexA [Halomonas populi]RUR40702.1 transcriptional repressor LexA [Halomonas populi]RUR49208.1 transcriptional repressor LexA [Halomonas populi]RUR55699.1 transcriptional repressor LexA [Halomonas populi]
MSRPLTARQQNVFDFIVKTMGELGYPPTRAEIAKALGFRSPNAAEEHLRALERKGVIRIIRNTSRGIRLPNQEVHEVSETPAPTTLHSSELPPVGLPVIGEVAAGNPILAAEHIDRYCPLPAEYFTPKADYLLRVRGLSMKDVGILEGDLLAVHRTERVRDGQIVVARIEDEVTVKRFKRQGHQVTLIAENPDFAPIEIDLRTQSLDIEGVGVGVIRGGSGQALG